MSVGVTYNFVGIHDRLEAMRNREKRHVLSEPLSQRRLDDSVRLIVDRTRRLVQNEQLALADDRTRKRENLTLANGEVAAATRDGAVERDAAFVGFVLQREEAGGTQRVVERRVVVLGERVQVLAECAAE